MFCLIRSNPFFLQTFFKMKEMFFEDDIDDSKYCGHLYGLGTNFVVGSSSNGGKDSNKDAKDDDNSKASDSKDDNNEGKDKESEGGAEEEGEEKENSAVEGGADK